MPRIKMMVSGETKTPASQKRGRVRRSKKTICKPASLIRTVPSVPDSDRFGGAFAPFADLSAFPLAGCRFTAGVEFHHPLKQGHYSAAETPCQSPRREIPRFRLPANPLGGSGAAAPGGLVRLRRHVRRSRKSACGARLSLQGRLAAPQAQAALEKPSKKWGSTVSTAEGLGNMRFQTGPGFGIIFRIPAAFMPLIMQKSRGCGIWPHNMTP